MSLMGGVGQVESLRVAVCKVLKRFPSFVLRQGACFKQPALKLPFRKGKTAPPQLMRKRRFG